MAKWASPLAKMSLVKAHHPTCTGGYVVGGTAKLNAKTPPPSLATSLLHTEEGGSLYLPRSLAESFSLQWSLSCTNSALLSSKCTRHRSGNERGGGDIGRRRQTMHLFIFLFKKGGRKRKGGKRTDRHSKKKRGERDLVFRAPIADQMCAGFTDTPPPPPLPPSRYTSFPQLFFVFFLLQKNLIFASSLIPLHPPCREL